MTHFLSIGGVTHNAVTYRARADRASTLQFDISTSPDLSGATRTPGVAVVSDDDFTGGEAITGLLMNQRYYGAVVVDGVRQHTAPYLTFKTAPTPGVDASFKAIIASCSKFLPAGPVFSAIKAENADFFQHMGDLGYPDSTVIATLRAAYREQYDDTGALQVNVFRWMPFFSTWDDHDSFGNNENGDAPNKQNSLQVAKEYRVFPPLANPSQGIWYSYVWGNAEFFVLDTRYQREGGITRFPAFQGNRLEAGAGSGRDRLFIDPADAPTRNRIGWYVDVEVSPGVTIVERVTAYDLVTFEATLTRAIPGLTEGTPYYMKPRSMLDMNYIADNQVDWFLNAINSSTKKVRVICSSNVWNPTSINSGDSWGDWDPERVEQRFLIQHIDNTTNVFVVSGDRHRSGLDDGESSVFPEGTSSPLQNTNLDLAGGWNFGTYGAGPSYMTFEVTATTVTMTIKDANGNVAAGTTPMVMALV